MFLAQAPKNGSPSVLTRQKMWHSPVDPYLSRVNLKLYFRNVPLASV